MASILRQWFTRIGIPLASQQKLVAMGIATPQDLMTLREDQYALADLRNADECRRLTQLVERVREASRQGQQKRRKEAAIAAPTTSTPAAHGSIASPPPSVGSLSPPPAPPTTAKKSEVAPPPASESGAIDSPAPAAAVMTAAATAPPATPPAAADAVPHAATPVATTPLARVASVAVATPVTSAAAVAAAPSSPPPTVTIAPISIAPITIAPIVLAPIRITPRAAAATAVAPVILPPPAVPAAVAAVIAAEAREAQQSPPPLPPTPFARNAKRGASSSGTPTAAAAATATAAAAAAAAAAASLAPPPPLARGISGPPPLPPSEQNSRTSMLASPLRITARSRQNAAAPSALARSAVDENAAPPRQQQSTSRAAASSTNARRGKPTRRGAQSGASRKSAGVNRSSAADRDVVAARIQVMVRKRPMSRSEMAGEDSDCIGLLRAADAGYTGTGQIVVNAPKERVDLTKFTDTSEFRFDGVFTESATNEQVYRRTAARLIECVFRGGKATCFAYGQTGSGKTFTMLGSGLTKHRRKTALPGGESPGLYVMAAEDIFRHVQSPAHAHLHVTIAFFEIYGGGKIFDLLNGRKKLRCLEDANGSAVVVGLKRLRVDSTKKLLRYIERGNAERSTGTTAANSDSSRSHAIMQIGLQRNGVDGSDGLAGQLSFVDLAGSERGKDTAHTDRQTRREGAEINKSLLALKECIRALHCQHHHLPFRQSKLTQVMKDSFTGSDTQTVMIAMIAPNAKNVEHTLNTLRYAYRVKEIADEGEPEDDDLTPVKKMNVAVKGERGQKKKMMQTAVEVKVAKKLDVALPRSSKNGGDDGEAWVSVEYSAATTAAAASRRGLKQPEVPARPPRLSPASEAMGGYVDVLNGESGLKSVLGANRHHAALLHKLATSSADLVSDMESPGALSRMSAYSDALQELIKRERVSLHQLEVRAAAFAGKLRQQEQQFLRS